MAERKIEAGTMLLHIDPLGGTDYDTVVCLTSVDDNNSLNVIDATTFCGPDKQPGQLDFSIDFEGQHLLDPNTGKISGASLYDLLINKTTIGWKISPAIPAEGDIIKTGTGFISDLSNSYTLDNPGVFSASIGVQGTPTQTIQSS